MCKGGPVRFIVYGAGAIGGLVAALFVEHGEDVVVIARGAHADAIERSGLAVDSVEGRRTVSVPVVRQPAEAAIASGDVVLLGMKSQDTAEALTTLRGAAPASTPVACLQNGVENERAALRLFANVYGVWVMCPAAHLEPGVIQSFSAPVPGVLDVGRYPSGTDGVSLSLAEAFRCATFDSQELADIMRWKYRKLLLNLSNAAEAIFTLPGRSEITELAMKEGMSCLTAAGLDFASAEEEGRRRGDLLQMQEIDGRPRGGGSSWQSLQRGVGSIESDFLNGEIVLMGRRYGVPTPVNSLLQEFAWDRATTRAAPQTLSTNEFFERLAHSDP
jgi:2-dehydropantoate 2-reductase